MIFISDNENATGIPRGYKHATLKRNSFKVFLKFDANLPKYRSPSRRIPLRALLTCCDRARHAESYFANPRFPA